MKISYRSHPALKVIQNAIEAFSEADDKGLLTEEGGLKSDDIGSIKDTLSLYTKAIGNIQVISKNFEEAANLSFDALQKPELYKETYGKCGIFLVGKWTTIYHIVSETSIHLVKFFEDRLVVRIYCNEGNINSYMAPQFTTMFPGFSNSKLITFFTTDVATLLIFIKYAKVTTKELPPNSRIKDISCNYDYKLINETAVNVKLLDITWYTTLKKSDGFDVRGHWRLQPKKIDGLWSKEIIWINPFKKEGYTRKAGILTQQD